MATICWIEGQSRCEHNHAQSTGKATRGYLAGFCCPLEKSPKGHIIRFNLTSKRAPLLPCFPPLTLRQRDHGSGPFTEMVPPCRLLKCQGWIEGITLQHTAVINLKQNLCQGNYDWNSMVVAAFTFCWACQKVRVITNHDTEAKDRLLNYWSVIFSVTRSHAVGWIYFRWLDCHLVEMPVLNRTTYLELKLRNN